MGTQVCSERGGSHPAAAGFRDEKSAKNRASWSALGAERPIRHAKKLIPRYDRALRMHGLLCGPWGSLRPGLLLADFFSSRRGMIPCSETVVTFENAK